MEIITCSVRYSSPEVQKYQTIVEHKTYVYVSIHDWQSIISYRTFVFQKKIVNKKELTHILK